MKKHIITALISGIVLWMGSLMAQEPDYLRLINNPQPGTTFQEIQQKAEAWFKDRDQGRGTGYKQWKRWEYLTERRLGPNGELVNAAKMNWDAYHRYMGMLGSEKTEVANGSWYFLTATNYALGPSGYNPGIGRVNCITFHPSDANTFWIGMPSGGMWKTTNNGTSWSPLADGLPAIGVSGIAVNPSNVNEIYIATGDGDAGDTKTIGVLKSTNGGTTWLSTGLSYDVMDNQKSYKLIMHPTNSSILWSVQTDGLWRTTNSGATWTNMKTGSFRDLEFKPSAAATMYASTTSQFFRSLDSGLTWTEIFTGLPTGESRIAIGVSPSNSAYVYLLCGPGGSGGASTYKGVYRSTDSGATFSTRSTTPNILGGDSGGGGTGDQAWYDLAIAVSRTNISAVMTGGINTWTSANGGSTWAISSHWALPNAIGYTHADIHALEINPLNNRVYCGSDGGIFYTADFGLNWTDISSGIANTQWYRIAGYEPNTSLIIGGTQDNGSNKYTGSTTFTHIYGADGMDAMIDHTNSNIMYFSSQNGGLRKSTDAGNTSTGIAPGGTGAWVTPYVMDPNTATTIYGGYDDVYKSTNGGSTWTNQGVDGRGAMALGTSFSGRVYASNGSSIWRSDDYAVTWTSVSTGLPGNSITFIAVNPDNSMDVFVTLSGFTAGQKVYRSTNGGANWTNISGNLPNIIVNCIAYEDRNASPDDAIYIGTDVGVFYRNNTLGDWLPFSNWLPTVPVFDLEVNESANVITAGTYGRGLWRSSTYTTCDPGWNLCCEAHQGYSYYQASDSIRSSRYYTKGVGQTGIYKAGNKVRLITGFNVAGGSEFKAYLGSCGAGIPDVRIMGSYEGPMEGAIEVTSGLEALYPDKHLLVYPNPFETMTNVEFLIPESQAVRIYVTDLSGRVVRTLVDGEQYDPGSYKVSFDGSPYAAGTYLVSMEAGAYRETVKIILAK